MSRLILPRTCVICQIYHQGNLSICWHCQSQMPRLDLSCRGCGQAGWLNCPRCTHEGSLFRHFFAVYPYCPPIKSLIHRFKTEPAQDILKLFIHDLLQSLTPDLRSTECLIPIPLHPKSLSQRGFHHTAFLTKHLSKNLKIPWSLRYCQKTKFTPKQAELDQEQRQQNLIGAFRCQPLPYRHITLIDDVATTGQTLRQVALGFLAQGITTIDVWVLARA